MAGYPRDIGSIEQALKSLIKDLKEAKIKEVTNKSEIWFRTCSDPNERDKNIDHQDAINLDIASLKEGKGTPMFQAHKSQIQKATRNLKKSKQITSTLSDMTIALGNLNNVVKKATSPESRAGVEIDTYEQEEVYKAIKEIEDRIAELKLFIENRK